ncbi:hypothetical protein GCM10007938_36710 [Vibrio zhanjiangensis]|uniref:Uncharacterized protein n=1 Tax=Vibrio zhanjiangensis TaxID=1046128 RepID=A0ABQ6F2Y6_9VIBR|nr:hypothetical protein [Vibrio zhanjiangensis]GLT19888.1 hypothetical protein GCM10007938_36710 [Vibrio zhanjiangensis]
MEHLEISILGSIQKNNFASWKLDLLEQIASTNLELETDNDFATASDNVKSLKIAEKTLKECKIKALEQTHDIQQLFSAIDEVSETARETRLILERQVRTRKQQIKSELVTQAQLKLVDYCKAKSEIFSYLDQEQFTAVSKLEAAIKGKASLSGVERALDTKVKELMQEIDAQEQFAHESYQFISNQSDQHRVLLQDMQYLLSLPLPELKLTVENRIVKLSEQQALKSAQESESELLVASCEAVHGARSETISNYVISIEVSSTRSDAIEIARSVKQHLTARTQVTDIKLNIQRD